MCTPSPLSAPVNPTKDTDKEVSSTQPLGPTAPVPRPPGATDLPSAADSVGFHNTTTTPATSPKLETLGDSLTATTNLPLPFKQELVEDSEEEDNDDTAGTSGNEGQSSNTMYTSSRQELEKCIYGCPVAHLTGAQCPRDPTCTPSHANTSDHRDRDHPARSLCPTADTQTQATPAKPTHTTKARESPLNPDRQNPNRQIQPISPGFHGFPSSITDESRIRNRKMEEHNRSMAQNILKDHPEAPTPVPDVAIALRQGMAKIRKQKEKETYLQASKNLKLQEKKNANPVAKRKSKVVTTTKQAAPTTTAAQDTDEPPQEQRPSLIDKLRRSTRNTKIPGRFTN